MLTTMLSVFRIETEYPELLLPASEKRKLLEKQALDNTFHQFVENNLILHQGLLDKRKVRTLLCFTNL